MRKIIDNKVVVITGALGLLGQSFCRSIAQEGASVVMADIDSTRGKNIENELNDDNGDLLFHFHHTDITDSDSIKNLISATHEKYGKIDGFINNAYPRNKSYGRKFEEVQFLDFCENVNMHLGGYFLATQQIAEYFKEQGYGNIINISSIYGVLAPRFDVYEETKMTMPVEYAVIKSALIQLSKYVAKYYKGSNIRINSLSPGGILDGQPIEFLNKYKSYCLSKGMLDKEDIIGTLLFLLSDMSKYINGQNIIVDDGFTV